MQNCDHKAFHQPYMHVVIAIFCSLLSMCYIASIFHVLTHFRAATFMLQTFQMMSKVPQVVIFHPVMSLELMDSLYPPSLLLLSYLDGLKPYLL